MLLHVLGGVGKPAHAGALGRSGVRQRCTAPCASDPALAGRVRAHHTGWGAQVGLQLSVEGVQPASAACAPFSHVEASLHNLSLSLDDAGDLPQPTRTPSPHHAAGGWGVRAGVRGAICVPQQLLLCWWSASRTLDAGLSQPLRTFWPPSSFPASLAGNRLLCHCCCSDQWGPALPICLDET